jgi:hypothetical protein
MIDVTATRRVRWNGTEYAKGAKVPMTAAEFTALEPTGRFERAPAEKPVSKAKATTSTSSETAD